MTLLLVGELFAGYFFVAALICLFGFATWDWLRDADARRRMDALVAASDGYEREERLSMELDYIFGLPSREPRA